MSAVPMPRPWCDGATQTGATPATAEGVPSRRPGVASVCAITEPDSSATSSTSDVAHAGGPRAADDCELLRGVPGVVGEGRVDHGEDVLLVSRSLRGRTSTLTEAARRR